MNCIVKKTTIHSCLRGKSITLLRIIDVIPTSVFRSNCWPKKLTSKLNTKLTTVPALWIFDVVPKLLALSMCYQKTYQLDLNSYQFVYFITVLKSFSILFSNIQTPIITHHQTIKFLQFPLLPFHLSFVNCSPLSKISKLSLLYLQ